MLQELDKAVQSKEQLLAEYTPIRTAVEDFLKAGIKIKGQNRVLYTLNVASALLTFSPKEFPLGENRTYWKRETSIPSTQGPPIPVLVQTERVLFRDFAGYSDQVDKAMILVGVGSSPEGRIVYLPPIWSLQQSEISPMEYKNIANIQQRLSDVLPHLH